MAIPVTAHVPEPEAAEVEEPQAALSVRQRRLADLPAQVVLSLLPLLPKGLAPLDAVSIEPRTDGSEGVVLRAGGRFAIGEFRVDAGEALETVTLPRHVLVGIRRRHSDAERLVADQLAPGMFGWRTFGADATLALSAPKAPPVPAWPTPGDNDPEYEVPLFLDPRLVSTVMGVASSLGAHSISWAGIHDGTSLGCEIRLDAIGPGEERIEGSLLLARCAVPADCSQ